MLGFRSRIEVHAFLKEHGVYLHYDVSDLKQDEETASLEALPQRACWARMIIVADTSPINYLVLIKEIEVLCRTGSPEEPLGGIKPAISGG